MNNSSKVLVLDTTIVISNQISNCCSIWRENRNISRRKCVSWKPNSSHLISRQEPNSKYFMKLFEFLIRISLYSFCEQILYFQHFCSTTLPDRYSNLTFLWIYFSRIFSEYSQVYASSMAVFPAVPVACSPHFLPQRKCWSLTTSYSVSPPLSPPQRYFYPLDFVVYRFFYT